MATQIPQVFSVAAGAPFLASLADALLDGTLVEGFSRAEGPLALAAATIYVPTRRAAQALIETLADRLPGPSALLPRIVPLGRLDAMETAHLFHADEPGNALDPDLPQAIGDIARRTLLARLILHWGRAVRFAILSVNAEGVRKLAADEALLVATTPADAWHLSGELAGLIDELIIEGIDWTAFAPLGAGAFDDYWRITLDFLDIAIRSWPAILAERGLVDRATRQEKLIEKEIVRLAADRSGGPLVVAGSTGTNRATAALMAAIARAPRGAVVLPGLDTGLDEASWALVGSDTAAGHPQAALHRLLPRLGVTRQEVRTIGAARQPLASRARFVSEALRPADTTDLWQARGTRLADAEIDLGLADLVVIEAPDERTEALAVAVALREALETPGRTAALITPDRDLARRVRGELGRWNIEVEDSGGEPLAQVGIGALAVLTAACAASRLAPPDLLALLSHPRARLGRRGTEIARLVEALEVGVLRGFVPQAGRTGSAALVAAARAAAADRNTHPACRRIRNATWQAIERLLVDLGQALEPLAALAGEAPLDAWRAAHRAAVLALLREETGHSDLAGDDGAALAELYDGLEEAGATTLAFDLAGYAAFFEQVAAELPVRAVRRGHPRLKILGLLEARLLAPDLVVLGGLDETIWPPQARADAFLNRPMRAALGLTPPERRIGQTAHDFAEALGAPHAVLSRARKRGGAPTVASRFLQRMAALAGEGRWSRCRAAGERYLGLTCSLDRPIATERIGRPEPRPPLGLRPRRLSVTRIEVLRRDPYAIYAERILRLVPLDPIDMPLGARELGTSLHQVIGAFTLACPGDLLPADGRARLLASARDAFDEHLRDADFRAFQWPRITRNIDYFLAWEAARRGAIAEILVEVKGSLQLQLASGGTFELTATADRIERGHDGSLVLIDYKTGQPPGLNEVLVGFAPQLTLEAAMAREGAFPGIAAGTPVAGALYLKLGAGSGGGEPLTLRWQDQTFAEVVERHFRGVHDLLDGFESEATPYLARPFPKFAARFAPYDHLARVKEWSATGDAPGGDGE